MAAGLFAVISEAPTEAVAFANAQSWVLSAPLLAGRTRWVYLDNWVLFPSDKNALSRAYGAFARYGGTYPEKFAAGPGTDVAWALKINPLKPGNRRLIFFGLTDGQAGLVTLGPAQLNPQPDPLHDLGFWSDE